MPSDHLVAPLITGWNAMPDTATDEKSMECSLESWSRVAPAWLGRPVRRRGYRQASERQAWKVDLSPPSWPCS